MTTATRPRSPTRSQPREDAQGARLAPADSLAPRGRILLRAAQVAALLSQAAARAGEALVTVNLGATKEDERLAYARELAGNASTALTKALDALT